MAERISRRDEVGPGLSYFEIQAYMGTTKHLGGFETTRELIDLCHVSGDTVVLDVGCGAGATACHLAGTYGCRVVALDLRASMLARSTERARREGVEARVEIIQADAQTLPFRDAHFDVVLCESVATFIADKPRVVAECARVVGPGGYVGLNEAYWIKPPPLELVAYARRVWDIEPDVPPIEAWQGFMEGAGLQDIVVKPYRFDIRRESSQLCRYSLGDMLRMVGRLVPLYIRDSAFRAYMRARKRVPKHLFDHLGYGLFVGRKAS
jgi:SAM-dependent methyltransferase